MSKTLGALVAVAALAGTVHGTSGIAVSLHADSSTAYSPPLPQAYCCTEYPLSGKIWRYDIVNDQVVASKMLDSAGEAACSRWATLNISGTKCAYFHAPIVPNGGGGYMAQKWYITVVDIDGRNRRNILDLSTQSGDGTGYLDWPKGDWIYYNLGGNGAAKSSEIWRVNEQTGAKEQVASLPYKTWVWNLSANADRITIRKADASNCANEILRFAFPSEATTACTDNSIVYGQGCTNAISPSGTYIFSTTDAGHAAYSFGAWQNSTSLALITYLNYNAWAVNCASIKMPCTDGNEYTVGLGCEENRYSANSDKWVCFNVGWQPRGRFYECGGNQVLINWQDHKTIMVSFNPRKCVESSYAAFCTDEITAQYMRRQEAGDFVVTAPDSEINADLRQYLTREGTAPRSSARLPSGEVHSFAGSGGKVTVVFPTDGLHRFSIHDMAGRLVAAREGTGRTEICDLRGTGGRGVYTVRVSLDGGGSAALPVAVW